MATLMHAIEKLDRLAKRIHQGEVVYFIGAGFSLDSEQNSAYRLMQRLLARFLAMHQVLTDELSHPDELKDLPKYFKLAFDLKALPDLSDPDSLSAHVKTLANKYYESNDWFSATFNRFLQLAFKHCQPEQTADEDRREDDVISETLRKLREFVEKVERLENGWLNNENQVLDPIPLDPIDPRLFFWAGSEGKTSVVEPGQHAGKALFLETMGFANPQVMIDGWEGNRSSAQARFGPKLFPRHWVLARLAREGLAPLVLTTNYDCLLEAAWRLSGFEPDAMQSNGSVEETDLEFLPSLTPRHMACVGQATDFFRYERGQRSANVLKVHGCVRLYRQARSLRDKDLQFDVRDWLSGNCDLKPEQVNESTWSAWRGYLSSMVFTYREVQHWRGDSWSRDYLATLQRTRNVVFAGYSLQDPVIHDAFRQVYEDMRRVRLRLEKQEETSDMDESPSPAWFWSAAENHSFYANEILDSAHAAMGEPRNLRTPHPNTLEFHFRDKGFPDYDDSFLWLFHRTFRTLQLDCLQSNLIPLANGLRDQPMLRREQERILRRFKVLMKCEEREARRLLSKSGSSDASTHSNAWRNIVNWTYTFGSGLVRELVALEVIQRCGGPSIELKRMRDEHWYHPASGNRNATAWSAIVELALRAHFGKYSTTFGSPAYTRLLPSSLNAPGVLARTSDGESLRLQIIAGQPDRQVMARQTEAVHREVVWCVPANRIPWPIKNNSCDSTQSTGSSPGPIYVHPPGAAELLDLARGSPVETAWIFERSSHEKKTQQKKKLSRPARKKRPASK